MPKLSRKQRKLLKETEQKKYKTKKNAVEPYSRHKTKVCCHYDAFGGMGIPVFTNSFLTKTTEDDYICSKCGKAFTEEQAAKIDALCRYLETAFPKSHSKVSALLTDDILPCEYYCISPDEKVICGTRNVIPTVGGLWVE